MATKNTKRGNASSTKRVASKPAAAASQPPAQRETVRVRAYNWLAANPGASALEVQRGIGLSHSLLPTLAKAVALYGHLAYVRQETGVARFELTPAGVQALRDGTANPARGNGWAAQLHASHKQQAAQIAALQEALDAKAAKAAARKAGK